MRDSLRRVRDGHDWIFTCAMNPIWTTGIEISLESDGQKESNQMQKFESKEKK
jgi:hypothetical protein